MNQPNRLVRTGFRIIALAALVVTLVHTRANAQVTFTGACAPSVAINNTTNCSARLRFQPAIGPTLPVILVPPGGTAALPIPAGGLTLVGVWSLGGIQYGITAPPPGGCTCLPTDFYTCCVTLNPAAGCCFDVCYDPATCTITLRASTCAVCQV